MKRYQFSRLMILLFTLLLLLSGCQGEQQGNPPLSIHLLDVGQGDSTLIVTPDHKTILIDGGEAEAAPYISSYLNKLKIERIDYLIATHPHSDHIGGLAEIINSFEIGELIMPQVLHTTKTFEKMLLAAEEKNLTITAAKGDQSYQLNDEISLQILGPLKDYGDNLNNWSVVARVQYNQKAFLFMGDAETPVEADLVNYYEPLALASHFLRVGHHGSDTSSSKAFLEVVQPEISAISVGKENPYGHPHREIIERLSNTAMYRTDQQGTIVLYCDGTKIWSHQKPIEKGLE